MHARCKAVRHTLHASVAQAEVAEIIPMASHELGQVVNDKGLMSPTKSHAQTVSFIVEHPRCTRDDAGVAACSRSVILARHACDGYWLW